MASASLVVDAAICERARRSGSAATLDHIYQMVNIIINNNPYGKNMGQLRIAALTCRSFGGVLWLALYSGTARGFAKGQALARSDECRTY
jgi:hypothetical protein